ncbi:MAG: HNH endonuclease [Gelidibacter sp.]
MEKSISQNDLELHQAFEIILSIKTFSKYISAIAEMIYKGSLNSENLNTIVNEYKIENVRNINEELLDLILVYINLVLNDHVISDNERKNIELLKIYFKIKEGDFIQKRHSEVEDVLQRQFERQYADNKIDQLESLHSVDLQQIFDLSYDQFDQFKEREIINALARGADITKLDTTKYPKLASLKSEVAGRQISQEVKDSVWNRDKGKCRACDNNQKLEFVHIIPFSKGGSNTYRNLQLLCEPCNRLKSNKI